MSTSIFTALILCCAWLDPSIGIGPATAREIDRPTIQAVEAHSTTSLRSWPDTTPSAWDVLDADLEEQEDGDGDPEGLAPAESAWLLPRLLVSGLDSPIRRDLALVLRPTRSKILRC